MLKPFLSFIAAGAVFVAASPAPAQYSGARPDYPMRAPAPDYEYAHGHGSGEVRELQQRIDAVRHRITRLDSRDVIRARSADRLLREADGIERRLHDRARRGGLDPREAGDIQYRLQRLEQRLQFAIDDRGPHRERW